MLQDVSYTLLQGNPEQEITNIAYHTDQTIPGSMFVCIEGVDQDGHIYAEEAIKKGAVVILCSAPLSYEEPVTIVQVENCRRILAEISAVYYGHPAKKMKLIAVTGTKGKTTVAHMIRDVFLQEDVLCGLVGTVEVDTGKTLHPAQQTTPESLDLHRLLKEMNGNGCQAAVIEVSSQAVKQYRIHGLEFEVGVLTNIGRDHIGLREHASFDEYLCCKGMLFRQCKAAVVNKEIPHLQRLHEQGYFDDMPVYTYSVTGEADLYAEKYRFIEVGKKLGVEFFAKGRYNIKLVVGAPGLFSIYNSLAAALTMKILGFPAAPIKKALLKIAVPGRQELFLIDTDRLVVVDYAHNGAGLQALLSALRCYGNRRLTCVFGCGGMRDPARRGDMGRVSAMYADFTIITADNPRKEALEDIIEDIVNGIAPLTDQYMVIRDRQDAIEYAIRQAKPKEIIVITGKGHESVQLLAEETIHFDDREIVKSSIEKVKYEQNYNRRNRPGDEGEADFRKADR